MPGDLVPAAVRPRNPRHPELARQPALQRASRRPPAPRRAPAAGTSCPAPGACRRSTVLTSRATWLWMWSCGSPSRLVPCSHDVTVISASSNRPGSCAVDARAVVAGPGHPGPLAACTPARPGSRPAAPPGTAARPRPTGAASRSSPASRARRSFSRIEAWKTEIDFDSDTVMSVYTGACRVAWAASRSSSSSRSAVACGSAACQPRQMVGEPGVVAREPGRVSARCAGRSAGTPAHTGRRSTTWPSAKPSASGAWPPPPARRLSRLRGVDVVPARRPLRLRAALPGSSTRSRGRSRTRRSPRQPLRTSAADVPALSELTMIIRNAMVCSG